MMKNQWMNQLHYNSLKRYFIRYGFSKVKKIPVKIVQVQDIHGTKRSVMLDAIYYFEFESKDNSNKKVEDFKKLYFKVVEQIKDLFYGKNDQRKYRNLPSSLYYELATIIYKFNQQIEHDFFITNYDEALHRDFNLSKDYIYDLRIIAKIFNENVLVDMIIDIVTDQPYNWYISPDERTKLYDMVMKLKMEIYI